MTKFRRANSWRVIWSPTIVSPWLESGAEAVAKAQQLLPDAITLDILMPGGSGFETLVALRRTPETANIPIIIVSIVDQQKVGFALGATDYLIKPIQKPALLESIRKHVPVQTDDDAAILLVDDDSRNLELVSETLRAAGYETQSVRERCQSPGSIVVQTRWSRPARFVNAGNGWFPGDSSRPPGTNLEGIAHSCDDCQESDPGRNRSSESRNSGSIAEERIVAAAAHCRGGKSSWRRQADQSCRKIMIKVLIAEDNPVNRELLRELLEGRGYEVEEACDGEEALAMIERARPNVLLLDLGMPKLDGLRRDPENP